MNVCGSPVSGITRRDGAEGRSMGCGRQLGQDRWKVLGLWIRRYRYVVPGRPGCNARSATLQDDALVPNLRAQADSAEMGRAFRTTRISPSASLEPTQL